MESSEAPRPITPEQQLANTKELVGKFPPELQAVIATFFADTAKSIMAQQTSVSGDDVRVAVTPDQLQFYKGRIDELGRLGIFNPRGEGAGKKITYSE